MRKRYVQALDLSPGFSDFGSRQSMCWGSEWSCSWCGFVGRAECLALIK